MTEKRRQFSPQFKAEAVQMVVSPDRSTADVARELEINAGTLTNWVDAWRKKNPDPATATNPVEAARVAEMESEIRRLRMENEFLKKSPYN
ncbi:transposase [Rhodococcus sp. 27YEA15]|uniref:transposase n=1 Tax=Rhodococcus sp. 27YEA15 TaxID=3156259 RepID=UPI003C7D9DD1